MNTLPSKLQDIAALTSMQNAISAVEAGMPEVHRAMQSFGRSNSQVASRFMSLTMLTACSPFRVLRQCLAEIERRNAAIKESVFSLRIKEVEVDRLRASGDEIDLIRAEQVEETVADTKKSIVGALKDIATFQDAYKQVRVAHGIREDWDEEDFEAAEMRHHTRTAFLHAYRDVMAGGRIGMGTLEYLEQFGVHPQVALKEASAYYNAAESVQPPPTAEHLHQWLDTMADKYADAHKVTMARIGLDTAFSKEFIYLTK